MEGALHTMSKNKGRRILIKTAKIIGWIIASVVALLILVALAIQIPWVQQKGKAVAISFLQDKIGTKVDLERFSLSFPKKIVLTGFYLEDQNQDTLLYAGRLSIDTDLWALTKKRIELKSLQLEDITANISRVENDSAFNFDYILEAFADTTATEVDTTATPWDFALGNILVERLRFSLDDGFSGNNVNLYLGELDVSMHKFDLTNSIVAFDQINFSNIKASVLQTKIPETVTDSAEKIPEDSAAVAFNISFNEINLNAIEAAYSHTGLGQVIDLTIPEASIQANNIDIEKKIIELTKIVLRNSYVSFQQMNVEQPESVESVAAASPQQKNENEGTWSFALGELDLSGNTIQYHDYRQPIQKGAMDFNHLWITKLSTHVSNIRVSENDIQATIDRFSFREKSGFEIKTFRTALSVTETSVTVSKFLLQTNNSKIAMEAQSAFPSLEKLADQYTQATIDFSIISSVIGVKDILYFNPLVLDSLPLHLSRNEKVNIDAAMRGVVDDLIIERLQVHTLNNTSLFAHGRITGLPDMDKANFNINLDKFYTTRLDINSILPDTLIPSSISLPTWMDLSGAFKGTLHTPDVALTLNTNMGSVNLVAKLNMEPGVKESYDGNLKINQFQLGKLLKQPETIGKIDLVASVKGAGMQMDQLDALFNLTINELEYSGYTYRDFKVDGSMKENFFSGTALMEDDNLDFVLKANLDNKNEVPHYSLDFDLKNADFAKLNLTDRPLKAKLKFEVDLNTSDFQVLNGSAGIRDFAVYNGDSFYAIDSLLFASLDQEGQSELTIDSEIISGEFKGTLNVFALPDLLSRHFDNYFSMRDTVYAEPLENQNFKFNLVLKNTDLLTEVLFPDLDPFVPGEIAGEFNSAEHKLNLRFKVSEIKYAGLGIDTVSLRVISDKESFDFTFNLHKLTMDTMKISTMRLAGNIMHDSIRTNFMILDSLDKEKYFLGGVFNSFEDAFQFRFLKNHLFLNYEPWESPLDNSLQFTARGIEPNNFWIRNGEQRILLTKNNDRDSALAITFNEVNLKNITSLVEGTTPLSGLIDGDLNLGSAEDATFATDLTIKQLGIFNQIWGDLALHLDKKGVGPMNIKLNVVGDNIDLRTEGFLTSGDDPEISLEATLARLNLGIVEPLTMGQLKELKGSLSATASVKGKTKDPDINGKVVVDEADFLATYTNSYFNIKNESISLYGGDIRFEQFDISDRNNNTARIDGFVSSLDAGGFRLNLSLDATNFQLLNTTEKDNDLFYGKVGINTRTTIRGTSMLPIIVMNVSLSDESDITFVVPQSEAGIMEQEGIVVWVNKTEKADPFMNSINPRDTIKATFSGMDLTANIQVTDSETFHVIIDPATGDNLTIKGNSTLTLRMNPSGDMVLTGRYEISEGSYDLSFYKLIKRNFSITKGSSITWAGDPLNANMNIRAMHEVETSPIELVANQVDEAELNAYKRRLPFQVYLILKGELLSPEISFQLDMPDNEKNAFGGSVYAKLQDVNTRESDLNKQVFALLLLQRFISDNPLENRAGGSLAGSARGSVSKILSEQMNRLSQNIKGVELSFDVRSYEEFNGGGGGEGRTDLQLGVSKSLMNDRLVVKVAGNVNLEGETSNQNGFTDFIGDLALEYKLTEDGRFRITGFRNSNFDMIDGELIETGAGLIYIKDYDSLRELFKRNEKEKK